MNIGLFVSKDSFHIFGEQVAVEFQVLRVIFEPGVTGWAIVRFARGRHGVVVSVKRSDNNLVPSNMLEG